MNEGSIEVIVGPMFSSKSTQLMETARRCVIMGMRICFIIPARDDRYVPKAIAMNKSHDGICMQAVRVETLAQDPDEVAAADAVFVDEGHFFPGLGDFCLRQKRAGKRVYVAGLTSDYNGKPWPELQALVPAHVDKITLKHAVCVLCKGDALYTRKIAGDKFELVDFGSDDKYVSTCLTHLTVPDEVPKQVLVDRALAVARIKTLSQVY